MKLEPACVLCLLHWVYGRSAVRGDSQSFFSGIRRLLSIASTHSLGGMNTALLSNYLVEGTWDIFRAGAEPFYQDLKRKNNENAASLLPHARDFVEKGRDSRERFEKACMVAAAGNVAPLGAPSQGFEFAEVQSVLRGELNPLIRGDIYGTIKKARHILYVTDNAGEIGFDSLLLSMLKEGGCHVTLLVKEPLFFEDATMDDVRFFRLEKLVDQVLAVKGVFVPGESYPLPVTRAYEEADLIVSKGTGNFEALRGEVNDKSVIYMLKVKCGPIAKVTGVEQGRFIVDVDKSSTLQNHP